MAKAPKIYIEGAVYYVTSRGDNEKKIFEDGQDYQAYIELLKKYKQQYGFKLFSFVLMPTHLHLLIELKEGLRLSDIMHDLNSNYTKYFNSRYQRKGHLLQERYKMNLLEKRAYLLYMTAYIHLNPLVSGAVKDLEDYAYSSYGLYINPAKDAGLDLSAETKEINEILSGQGNSYENYMRHIPAEELRDLGKDLAKKTILGSQEFIKNVEAQVANYEAQLAKPQADKYGSRRFIFSGAGLIIVLTLSIAFLYIKTAGLRQKYQEEMEIKNREIGTAIDQERTKIKQDLEEKYAADRVSYEAMARRLEIEKEKVKDLEKKRVR